MPQISNAVINQKLDDLIERFDDFKDDYDKGKEAHIKEHERINREIYGNGGKGIKQEVAFNSAFRKNFRKILIGFGLAFVSQIVGLIFILIRS